MLRFVSRRISAISLVLLCAICAFAQTKSRHFELNYSFTVRITDPGKPLDIWFPMAQSDQYQQVKVLSKSGDLALKETTEHEYGNKMFYAHTEKATQPEYHFTVKYDVVRLEHLDVLGLLDPTPRTADWYRRIKARPSFQAGIVKWENEKYLKLMKQRGGEDWPKIKEIMQAV